MTERCAEAKVLDEEVRHHFLTEEMLVPVRCFHRVHVLFERGCRGDILFKQIRHEFLDDRDLKGEDVFQERVELSARQSSFVRHVSSSFL